MKNKQALVWQYLTLHRRHTGKSLSYLRLLQDAAYREEAIQASLLSGDEQLARLAERAHVWLNSRGQDGVPAASAETEVAETVEQPLGEHLEGATSVRLDEPVKLSYSDQVSSSAEPKLMQRDSSPSRALGAVTLLGVALAGIAAIAFVSGSWVGKERPSAVAVTSPPDAEDTVVHVRDAVRESQTWHADKTYLLETPVFVEAGVSLTIEAGTTIQGKQGAALIVTKDAKLYARGKRTRPIVFTSSLPEGERARGDWGGLVLLGNAPINQGSARIEGVDDKDPRGLFGGDIDGDSCGLLEYVRVEFAGYEVFADNELNGLTLGGCGHKTIVRNVQVHRSLDDGIEVFGGDVDLKNIVITGARDDGFDWDMGWHGRVQFLVVQQHADVGDNAFEADNWKQDHDAEPRSAPTFYNATLVGGLNAQKSQRAMTLRRGTAGVFRNFIVTGFNHEAIDVRDKRTAELATSGALTVEHALFFEIGSDGASYFSPEAADKDDDGQFDESRFFHDAVRHNRFGMAPLLSNAVFHESKPDFTPLPLSPATEDAAQLPEDEFWDQGARYLGAVRPGTNHSWIAGWTRYPKS